jgi:hypothetical protein
VIRAVGRFGRADRAFRAGLREAVLHPGRRQQEVLVGQVHRQFRRAHEAHELSPQLRVSEADGRRFAAIARIRVGVDQRPAEVRAVSRELPRGIVVLCGDRLDVRGAAAVMSEVFEVPAQPWLVVGRVRSRAGRRPVERVVGVGGHHRPAVVVEVREPRIERPRRSGRFPHRVVAEGRAVLQPDDDGRGAGGAEPHERQGDEHRQRTPARPARRPGRTLRDHGRRAAPSPAAGPLAGRAPSSMIPLPKFSLGVLPPRSLACGLAAGLRTA